MSSISLVSVYPIKINLPVTTNPEIVDIKPIDYLFQTNLSLEYDLTNMSTILDSVKFIQSTDLISTSNIKFNQVDISANLLTSLSVDDSLDELMKLILKDKIQSNYDIYLDSINTEVIDTSISALSETDLSSYVDDNLLLVYKFNLEHTSTDFISTFSDYLSLEYTQQESFEFSFGILYKLSEVYDPPEPEPEPPYDIISEGESYQTDNFTTDDPVLNYGTMKVITAEINKYIENFGIIDIFSSF